jgi:hypothetical protein
MAKHKQPKVSTVLYLLVLVPYMIFGFMLQYLYNLDKSDCKCAINNNQELLKKTILIWLGINVVNLVFSLFNNTVVNFVRILLSFVNVGVFVYLTSVFFNYNKELNKNSCKCAENTRKTVFKYYLYLTYLMIAVNLLFYIFYLAMVRTAMSKAEHNVIKVNL